MIITDPSLSPSKRLLEILNKYFLDNNYIFKKSYYERTHNNRIEKVYPSFLKWGQLVSGRIYWSSTFIDLERILNQMSGTKQRTLNSTIGQDLLNYSECRKNNGKDSFDLYDQTTHQYDNFSINKAANDMIESYQTFINPFFDKFTDLRKVEMELNSIPIKRTEFMNVEKHIVSGLILSIKYSSNMFDEIRKSYETYLNNSRYTDKEEYKIKINLTIDYIGKNEIYLPD